MNLQGLLQRSKDHCIILIPDKLNLGMNDVSFRGHLLRNKGLRRDPAKVEAIIKMPKPQDVEGVCKLSSQVPSKTV